MNLMHDDIVNFMNWFGCEWFSDGEADGASDAGSRYSTGTA